MHVAHTNLVYLAGCLLPNAGTIYDRLLLLLVQSIKDCSISFVSLAIEFSHSLSIDRSDVVCYFNVNGPIGFDRFHFQTREEETNSETGKTHTEFSVFRHKIISDAI